MSTLNQYFQDIRHIKVLTREEEVELAKKVLEGDEEAKELFIRSNLRLVISIASRYRTSSKIELSDLVQEGTLGLMKALERFDYTKGFKFSTYACLPTTTHLFTNHGFISHDQIQKGMKTLGYDHGHLEWTTVQKVHRYQNVPLVEIQQGGWRTRCTSNHRWVCSDGILRATNELEGREIVLWPDGETELLGVRRSKLTDYTIREVEEEAVWCITTGLGSFVARDEIGNVFVTGNSWWIRQAIMRAIMEQSGTIRVPVHILEGIHKINRESYKFLQEYGREPSNSELVDLVDMSIEKIERLQKVVGEPVSLETEIGDESSLYHIVRDNTVQHPMEQLVEDDLRDLVDETLDELSYRERRVLELRFGISTQLPEPVKLPNIQQTGHQLQMFLQTQRRV